MYLPSKRKNEIQTILSNEKKKKTDEELMVLINEGAKEKIHQKKVRKTCFLKSLRNYSIQ